MPASRQALGMVTSTLSEALPVMGAPANTGTVSAGAAGKGSGSGRQAGQALVRQCWARGSTGQPALGAGQQPKQVLGR